MASFRMFGGVAKRKAQEWGCLPVLNRYRNTLIHLFLVCAVSTVEQGNLTNVCVFMLWVVRIGYF